MRGRKPKPTALKVLEGNPGRRPLNKNEPKGPSGKPKLPSWLSERAKKFWKLQCQNLYDKKLLSKLDAAAFAGLCEVLGTLEECNEVLAREGMTIIGQSGFAVKHPCVNIKKENLGLLRQYCEQFGLTPSSRSRVSVTDLNKPENPLRAFLGKKN